MRCLSPIAVRVTLHHPRPVANREPAGLLGDRSREGGVPGRACEYLLGRAVFVRWVFRYRAHPELDLNQSVERSFELTSHPLEFGWQNHSKRGKMPCSRPTTCSSAKSRRTRWVLDQSPDHRSVGCTAPRSAGPGQRCRRLANRCGDQARYRCSPQALHRGPGIAPIGAAVAPPEGTVTVESLLTSHPRGAAVSPASGCGS